MKKIEEKLDFDKVWAALERTNQILDAKFQATTAKFQETDKIINELGKEIKSLTKDIKEQGKQIGNLHQERGSYTEVILMNSIEHLLMKDFKLDHFISDFWLNKKGDHIQLDALGYTNSNRNEAVIVEVKTKLRSEDIEQLEKQLKRVDKFLPELKDKKKFGVLVALQARPELVKKVYDAGFYFASVKNDLVTLKNPKNFKPKEY